MAKRYTSVLEMVKDISDDEEFIREFEEKLREKQGQEMFIIDQLCMGKDAKQIVQENDWLQDEDHVWMMIQRLACYVKQCEKAREIIVK